MARNVLEMELQSINNSHIQLHDFEIKRNNVILKNVMDAFLEEFKKDPFFNSIYERSFFGGSFYDGLKVGKPNEFDIDFVFALPLSAEPMVISKDEYPGYVQVQLKNMFQLSRNYYPPSYLDMQQLVDCNGMLRVDKIMRWFQAKIDKTRCVLLAKNVPFHIFQIIVTTGPAVTLKIGHDYSNKTMDIDFVPCFKFFISDCPNICRISHRMFHPFDQLCQEFFVVPKCSDYDPTFQRLSFQGQERRLLNNRGHLKPAIRLLKFYRDKYHHFLIKSYFIKTLALWAVDDPRFEYIEQSLAAIFLQLLDRLIDAVKNERLDYYWNPKLNLFPNHKVFLLNFYNQLVKHREVFKSGNSIRIHSVFLRGIPESFGWPYDDCIMDVSYEFPKKRVDFFWWITFFAFLYGIYWISRRATK